MKKILSLLLALLMLLSFTACSKGDENTGDDQQQEGKPPMEIIVFAAASMQETLSRCVENYKSVASEVTVTVTFESSGTLLKNIQAGADCDLFISAAQKQMDALDGSLAGDTEKNPDGLDYVLQGTRVDLLENKVALVVPEGNPAGIQSFADLKSDKLRLMALGNSDVPVGSYSLEILRYLDMDIKALEAAGKVSYGSNVKEVTTQVAENAVDCGMVYATDAYSAGLAVVDTATADMCKQVLYPAAVIKTTEDSAKLESAKAFLAYLRSGACTPVFEEVGFTVIQ